MITVNAKLSQNDITQIRNNDRLFIMQYMYICCLHLNERLDRFIVLYFIFKICRKHIYIEINEQTPVVQFYYFSKSIFFILLST